MHPRDWAEEESGWSTDELVELLGIFLAHPSARFLRNLTIQNAWHEIDDEGVMDPIVAAIAETEGPWDALSSLEMVPDLDSYGGNEINNGDLLFKNLPALRALKIRCDLLHFREPLDEPPLARLSLHDCISQVVVRAIAGARWPNLFELDLTFGRSNARPEHMRLLFARPDHFPQLTTLRMRRAGFSGDIVDALLGAPQICQRLEVLDLSGGNLTNDPARALVNHASLFPKLKRLDVSDNQLETEINIDLRKLPCKVIFGEQNLERYDDDRFDGIQE
jgi:hypothetical protein